MRVNKVEKTTSSETKNATVKQRTGNRRECCPSIPAKNQPTKRKQVVNQTNESEPNQSIRISIIARRHSIIARRRRRRRRRFAHLNLVVETTADGHVVLRLRHQRLDALLLSFRDQRLMFALMFFC